MRIAIVTAWYPSKQNPLYGIFVQNQARALSKHCKVTVLLLNWSLIPYLRFREEGDVTVIEKGDFYLPNASELMLNFWASRYIRFFQNIHEQKAFDLIHCHDHYGAYVGAKIKDKFDLPIICTIHNSNIMNDKLVNWKKAYIPRILKKTDRVISVGNKLASVLEEKYGITDVKVIPNYIDTNRFSIDPQEKSSEFRYIFIGGLEPHKGIFRLVKAFHEANVKDTSLHIIGSGELEDSIRNYISDNQLESTIHLYGDVPNESIAEHYNASNVLVSVSEYETFGVTILEAMSCGLPILYTLSGGPDDLVEDFAGIKIEDRSIEGIAEGLKKIKEAYPRFDAMKIRAHVIENFGEQHSIGALINEYKSILHVQA